MAEEKRGWAMPLTRICLVTIFMMLAVISWRRSRLEAVLFGAGGVCYLIYCIVKMLI